MRLSQPKPISKWKILSAESAQQRVSVEELPLAKNMELNLLILSANFAARFLNGSVGVTLTSANLAIKDNVMEIMLVDMKKVNCLSVLEKKIAH